MVPVAGFSVDVSWDASCAHIEIVSATTTMSHRPMGRTRRTRKPKQSNKMPLSWGQNLKSKLEAIPRLRVLVFHRNDFRLKSNKTVY
jgi:hypothetical protein